MSRRSKAPNQRAARLSQLGKLLQFLAVVAGGCWVAGRYFDVERGLALSELNLNQLQASLTSVSTLKGKHDLQFSTARRIQRRVVLKARLSIRTVTELQLLFYSCATASRPLQITSSKGVCQARQRPRRVASWRAVAARS